MQKIVNTMTDDKEMSDTSKKILSLVFLVIAGAMSLMNYIEINEYWFNTSFNFQPGFISTFVSILLISPLYLRNILKWNKSPYTLISLILLVFLFSSFVQFALGGTGNKSIVIESLLVAAVALSWLGLKEVAGGTWMLIILAVAYSAITNNIAMGFYGFIYVTAGFVGLVLHSELNPGRLVSGLKEEFANSEAEKRIKSDIQGLKERI